MAQDTTQAADKRGRQTLPAPDGDRRRRAGAMPDHEFIEWCERSGTKAVLRPAPPRFDETTADEAF